MTPMVREMHSPLSYKVWENKFKLHHLKFALLIPLLMSLGSEPDGDSDGAEYALFPEFQSLGEQFQITSSVYPASDHVAVSDSDSDVDSDGAPGICTFP